SELGQEERAKAPAPHSEAQPGLKFDYPPSQTIRCMTKLPGIENVRRRRRRNKRRQIQNVENVKEVCADCQLWPFTQKALLWQREVLSQCHIYRGIARSLEHVAARAARPQRRDVEIRARGLSEDACHAST